ncbi:MAG TPA: DNA replication/repair protein RecF [Bacteroidota bacterium]|nr:DNA replication/repair protein RecF [Bacteroidota bacterium]
MHLTTVRLQRFRNHADSNFEFGEGTNILVGENGHGKTNVLEGISYLCLTKSFFAASDALVVQFQQSSFEIDGAFVADGGTQYRSHVGYDAQAEQKRYTINRQHAEPLSSVVGKFPVVVCSPEHGMIITSGPSERRRFVDLVLSQAYPGYFQHLLEYRRVLKHRNKILGDAKRLRTDCRELLVPWNEQLISHGCMLMEKRKHFVDEFQPFIESAYAEIMEGDEHPVLNYRPQTSGTPVEGDADYRALLSAELEARFSDEQRYGITLAGPHRDEFAMTINGLDVRKYASQGQHKTFLVALKIGEFFFLKDRCHETPMMLLDDIFSELDEHRSSRLMQFVEGLSQTFITSTSPQLFETRVALNHRQHRLFTIRNGAIALHSEAMA